MQFRLRRFLTALFPGFLLLSVIACSEGSEARVIEIGNSKPLSFRMQALSGTRDGDMLFARCVFTGENVSSFLLDMNVRVGSPPQLEAGRFKRVQGGKAEEGTLTATSLTFLGGQADGPSLGGVFQLISSSGKPVYQVSIPTTKVQLRRQKPSQ